MHHESGVLNVGKIHLSEKSEVVVELFLRGRVSIVTIIPRIKKKGNKKMSKHLRECKCLICGRDFVNLIANTGASVTEIQNIHIVAHLRQAIEKTLKLLKTNDDIYNRPEIQELIRIVERPNFEIKYENKL